MAKKNYHWGKGYDRRQQEAQRKESKQLYKRREGARPMPYTNGEDMDEAEANYLTDQVAKYRKAWEAEKLISQANMAGWETAKQQLAKANTRRTILLLLGASCGMGLTTIVIILQILLANLL